MNGSAFRRRVRLLAGLAGGLGTVLTLSAAAVPVSWPARGAVTSYRQGSLAAVSVLSASDAWAVGSVFTSRGLETLILHWDGTRWARVASPSPSPTLSLRGVSVDSASDAWAVGDYTTRAGRQKTLILHWDGIRWAQTASPVPAAAILPELNAVSARSPHDVWAVGDYFTRSTGSTLLLHWNGRSWTRVPSPSPGGANGTFPLGVSAVSASDAWAVGYYSTRGGPGQTLILHWNGVSWKRIPSPASRGNQLNGVSAQSPASAWAVGYQRTTTSARPLVLRWNGTRWATVPSPQPSGDGSQLQGVSAQSRHDVWAAGLRVTSTGTQQTLTMHWNGRTWTVVASPDPGGFGDRFLNAVSTQSPHEAWAVGSAAGSTLILHWNGSSWTRS